MRFFRFLFCMTVIFTMVAVHFSFSLATTGEEFQPDYSPTLHIARLSSSIAIDGDLGDDGWRNAVRATNFVETNPGDQIQPSVQSAALMTYDESHLYVALIAWDDPEDIRAHLSDRDNIFNDDYFGIMLDTYGDVAWGYEIFVNPLGIQGDLRIMSDGDEDISLELIFDSRGIVTDSGYQVELAIPFASLRFPNKPVQTWRLNFWRDRQRDKRYRYSWTARDRDNSCFMCQWGTLTGIRDIRPGTNIDLLSNVIAYQSGAMADDDDPSAPFDNENPDAELSLNARYGISSNSSLELAINPDFSQVESDAGLINVNQTFALWYPERRPFFQEGSDLFDTWINVIHTRSINDPSVATKFTGQTGRSSVAYLLARDDNTPLIIPLQQQSTDAALENSTVNILRTRQTFLENSYVGLTITDRRTDSFKRDGADYGSGSGTVYGLDGRIRFSRNLQVEVQALGSYTDEQYAPGLIDTTQPWPGTAQSTFDRGRHTVALDGEKYPGHAISASLERDGRNWYADWDYVEYSPTFRADNGFVTSNDYRLLSLSSGLFFRPNREWLVEWSPRINISRKWDFDGTINLNPAEFNEGTIDEWIRPVISAQLKGQTHVYLVYLASRERFSGFFFDGISRGEIEISTRPCQMLSLGFNLEHGRSIYRQRYRNYWEVIPEDERENPDDSLSNVVRRPYMGIMTSFVAWGDLRLSQRLRIQPTFSYAELNHRDHYLEAHPDADREIYSGFILRTRISYQFTREWFLRFVTEYNDFGKQLVVEPLITYKINPFTVFYVGMNGGYQHYDQDEYEGLSNSTWRFADRQFFAKLQYLFRL